ncbi:MAG: mycothiol system anti-sigma-R factor [Halofilum sp. (in: g-proteobacteria)]
MNAEHIDCEDVIEQLFAFLDRELDEERQQRIERHLNRCRDCFTRAEFERRLRARIRDASEVKAPERLRRRIRGLLNEF